MNPQINLLHLKYFCDAVINQSISEAAKINLVTQSAVSQAIYKLEICLRAKILIHNRQKFQITEEGHILFQQARNVFKAVQEIHDKIANVKSEVRGAVKFVCTNSLAMSFIVPIFKKMQDLYPLVELDMKVGNQNFIRNSLKQKDCEFALVVYDKSYSQFSRVLIRKGFFHLYTHAEAPHDLTKEGVFIDFQEGMFIPELKAHYNRVSGQNLKINAALAGWEIVARCLEKNSGVGFLPDYILAYDRYPHLTALPFDFPDFPYEICAIFNKGEQLSRSAKAFIDLVSK